VYVILIIIVGLVALNLVVAYGLHRHRLNGDPADAAAGRLLAEMRREMEGR
jgi:hypothetical protein